MKDPSIHARVVTADTRRLLALRQLLERWGHAPQDADIRARTIYLVQIGYISMQVAETLESRLARIPSDVEIYTGRRPRSREVARFRGQFGL